MARYCIAIGEGDNEVVLLGDDLDEVREAFAKLKRTFGYNYVSIDLMEDTLGQGFDTVLDSIQIDVE